MANQIKTLRSQLGISQVEAARLLGISRSLISLLEIGKAAPKSPADLYLIQAQRLIDEIGDVPLQKALPLAKPGFIEKERNRLNRRIAALENVLTAMESKAMAALRLKVFLPLLQAQVGLEQRKLGTLIHRLERKSVDALLWNGTEAQGNCLAELNFLRAQVQLLDAM